MPEPISITILVVTIVTAISQLIQSIIDYKRDKLNQHSQLYETKEYISECCNFNIRTDDEDTKN